MTDLIPISGSYRSCPLHSGQDAQRLDVVRGDIDLVLAEDDPVRLLALAGNISLAPEARLLSAARLIAAHQLAAERRETRPSVDPQLARAAVAGLGSIKWRSSTHYASLLDPSPAPGGPRPVARPERLR
jgi:hypothetical protein